MHRSSLQLAAFAALGGAAGVLSNAGQHVLPSAIPSPSASADDNSSSPTALPIPCTINANAVDPSSSSNQLCNTQTLRASSLSSSQPFPFQIPLSLRFLTAKADGSGYDAMAASSPPSPPPSQGLQSVLSDAMGGAGSVSCSDSSDCDDDTITGVFHRLDPHKARLVLVQAVFRHGARTPLSWKSELWAGQQWDVCGETYKAAAVRLLSTAGVENPVSKNDLRQRSSHLEGGCHKGELTHVGQRQARDLGRWLRERYTGGGQAGGWGFLPPRYEEGAVSARTTNTSRTIATLRGVLTGLYPDLPHAPPYHPLRQQPQGDSEPMRVTVSGDLDEILYADTRACPHLGTFQALAREAGRAAARSDPEYPWVLSELRRLMGLDLAAADADRWLFIDVHDVLTSLAAHGKPLPPGFDNNPRLITAIDRLATKEFAAEVAPSVRDSHGRTVLALSMGRLLHTLVGNMKAAVTAAEGGEATAGGAQRPQLYLYSGHDSTIMPLLSALGLDVTSWPPYLSNLVLELWQLPPAGPSKSGHSHNPHHANQQHQQQQTKQVPPQESVSPPPRCPPQPRYVVRVLYNQDELPLPHCPPGFLLSLPTFERQVVGPFLLSAQHYEQLCRVKVEHEGSMPQPKAKPAHSA